MENIERNNCRLCNHSLSEPIIDLGNQYINDFPKNPKLKGKNGICPLQVVYCQNCKLYQLKHTAPQELLYSRHYWYKSSINDTIKRDLKEISEIAIKEADVKNDDIFLDIGANDGTLLSYLKGRCIRVGCEPATNLVDELRENADFVINNFWSQENYENLNIKKAKVITAIGMFYDMENPNKFIKDAANILDQNGVFIAQLMTLKPMIENRDLGNICHEHLEYYTYESLVYLFEKNGLEIYRLEENKINGGSYRIFARLLNKGSIKINEDTTTSNVKDFMNEIDEIKIQIRNLLNKYISEGKKIYGYGASTKGNVILQYFGINEHDLIAVADKNHTKFGLHTLTDIPIVSEDEARDKADVFFILPYGFTEEFIVREDEFLKKGGILVSPLPKLRIIDKKNHVS